MRCLALTSMLALLLVAGGCTASPVVTGLPAVPVYASAETEPVGTVNEDAADDPAIWHNAADPAASLIVATDKKAGLYVYGLDGKTRSFAAGGRLNNVDVLTLRDGTILVAASDRTDPLLAAIRLFKLDPVTASLTEVGNIPVGPGEAYGFCFGEESGTGNVSVFSPLKDGSIYSSVLGKTGDVWGGTHTKITKLGSQPEGCVYDVRTGRLYVGEENVGIWVTDTANNESRLVARIDNRQLVADVEGLALAPIGDDGGWLIASSQGDNTYARYRLPDMEPAGRFRIAAGTFGATEETDGIALSTLNYGSAFPGGLFVAQDGVNAPESQNFKLVSWSDVIDALGN